MRLTLIFAVLFLLNSCRQSKQNNLETNEYLEKQILNRIDVISASEKADSLMPALYDINREVGQLVLLSKDVENMAASVNRSNTYFDSVVKQYQLDSSDFVRLTRDMPLNDVETVIKKNELNLLNKIIFKHKIGTPMYTAQ
jgi:hypothetical protein